MNKPNLISLESPLAHGTLGHWIGISATLFILALLAPNASAGAPSAQGTCDGQTVPLFGSQRSAVTDDVSQPGGAGTDYRYQFTVCNLSDPGSRELIRDWELPWDPAAGIHNIMVPPGWAYSFETRGDDNPLTGWEGDIEWQDTGDDFYDPRYANHDQVLHFYTGCPADEASEIPLVDELSCFDLPNNWIAPGDDLAGFELWSPLAPTNSPYQASWVFQPVRTGDPAFPGVGAPTTFAAVPEPGTLSLLTLGLLAAGGRRFKHAS